MTEIGIIDWERAETLLEEIGGAGFCEVVAIFLEESDGVIQQLETAPDPARYEADLHFLKGSALNLGFSHLAALCQEGERRAAQGRAEEVDIGAVIRLYHASAAAFAEGGRLMCSRSSAA